MSTNSSPKYYHMSWAEVYERLNTIELPPHKPLSVFGVPRGGAIVAGMLGMAPLLVPVTKAEDAQLIVDDIIDSGKTKNEFEKFKVPFWGLVDKLGRDKDTFTDLWIVFPWEVADEHGRTTSLRSQA